MADVHFHPLYALNLIADLIMSRLIDPEDLTGSMLDRLQAGERARPRWINDLHMRTAREMFIFAERVVLPPGLELPVTASKQIREAIVYRDESDPGKESDDREGSSLGIELASLIYDPAAPDRRVYETIRWILELKAFNDKYMVGTNHIYDLLRHSMSGKAGELNFAPLVYESLRPGLIAGREVKEQPWRLTDAQKEFFNKIASKDPLKSAKRYRKFEPQVREAIEFASVAETLRCPTLAFLRPSKPATLPVPDSDAVALTRLYFDNVCLPSPETASEAMAYRSEQRVVEWRSQIQAWSDSVATGSLDLKTIKLQIEDASAHLEGARSLQKLFARIPHGLSLGLALLAEVAPHVFSMMPEAVAHTAAGMALSIDGVKFLAHKIYTAVASPAPSSYKWLMVGPPEHRQRTRRP